MFYYVLKYVILGPLLRLVFRPKIEGLEHVPESGAAIVAGNHLSFSDHFLMPAILKRRITFLAKAEYFTGPGIKGRLTAYFFRSAGQIPVDRSGKEAGQAAIREGLGVLSKDELLGIYPEGTRSHDGRLYKGKVGVAVMALRAQVPVIPCAMIGTFEAQPPGKKIPNIHPVVIRFGKPSTSPATPAWRTRRRSCAPSPTRSCTPSSPSPSRSTSTSTRLSSRPRKPRRRRLRRGASSRVCR